MLAFKEYIFIKMKQIINNLCFRATSKTCVQLYMKVNQSQNTLKCQILHFVIKIWETVIVSMKIVANRDISYVVIHNIKERNTLL